MSDTMAYDNACGEVVEVSPVTVALDAQLTQYKLVNSMRVCLMRPCPIYGVEYQALEINGLHMFSPEVKAQILHRNPRTVCVIRLQPNQHPVDSGDWLTDMMSNILHCCTSYDELYEIMRGK